MLRHLLCLKQEYSLSCFNSKFKIISLFFVNNIISLPCVSIYRIINKFDPLIYSIFKLEKKIRLIPIIDNQYFSNSFLNNFFIHSVFQVSIHKMLFMRNEKFNIIDFVKFKVMRKTRPPSLIYVIIKQSCGRVSWEKYQEI